MFYKYRVTLEGIKGFYRLYVVKGSNTLYLFHKQLRSDLEFPQDQPVLFKALDSEGNVVARYALIDLGFKAIDEVSIEDSIKAGAVKFVYFYDVASKKSVNITFEGTSEKPCALPTVVETKGPLPIEFEKGYVAFEDLPEEKKNPPHSEVDEDDEDLDDDEDFDDEDDDDDDDSSDKEDEELIYDENE